MEKLREKLKLIKEVLYIKMLDERILAANETMESFNMLFKSAKNVHFRLRTLYSYDHKDNELFK